MSNSSSFDVDDGVISYFDMDIEGDTEAMFEAAAGSILAYAQANAPWTDRTGMARAGLNVEVTSQGGEVILELFHTVDYGLWLEVIQGGNFAIIMPTLEQFAPMVFDSVGARITDIEGGEL